METTCVTPRASQSDGRSRSPQKKSLAGHADIAEECRSCELFATVSRKAAMDTWMITTT